MPLHYPFWLGATVISYALPSLLPSKHSNEIVKLLLFLLRLPGVAIRIVCIGGWFFFTLAIGLVMVFLMKNKHDIPKLVGRMNHWMASLLFGVVPEYQDLHHLQSVEKGVMIFNHQSFFDGVYLNELWSFCPGSVVGVAKSGLASWPLVGWYWKSVGGIFVENSHARTEAETKRNIELVNAVTKRIQDENLAVFLSPEGHRNSEPTILEFKKGAFFMAVNAGVPIVPIVVETFYDKIMECRFPWSPNVIQIKILEPISTKNISGKEAVTKLAVETREKMLKCLKELNNQSKIDSAEKKRQ